MSTTSLMCDDGGNGRESTISWWPWSVCVCVFGLGTTNFITILETGLMFYDKIYIRVWQLIWCCVNILSGHKDYQTSSEHIAIDCDALCR